MLCWTLLKFLSVQMVTWRCMVFTARRWCALSLPCRKKTLSSFVPLQLTLLNPALILLFDDCIFVHHSWWWSKKDALWVSFYSYTFIIVSTECELLIHILSITYFISTDVCAIVLLGLCSAHRCLHSCSRFQRGFFFPRSSHVRLFVVLFCVCFIFI